MHVNSCYPPPKIHFPLRIDADLYQRFKSLSERTRIPMSTLGRLSINSMIQEVDYRGITGYLDHIGEKYL